MPNDSAECTNLSSQRGDRFSSSGDGAYQEDQTESHLYRKRASSAKLYPAAKPPPPGSVGGSGCASDPKTDPLLSTFPSAIFSFWERIVNFKDFGGQISHFTKKMRRTKGQRWDKVGLSRMRDEVSSRLTIRRKAKCIKCERNDNMGDRPIHNSLIILECLLGRYRIDNLSNE